MSLSTLEIKIDLTIEKLLVLKGDSESEDRSKNNLFLMYLGQK